MYWIPAPSAGFWILSLLAALLFGAYMGVHYGTMGDAIDYGELISGVRCDGFLASLTSLAMKCGGAVGPATSGALLAALNYMANTQQTPQVLNAIDLTISVIPCAICVVNAILYLFYPISQKKHKEIMDELIRRRTVIWPSGQNDARAEGFLPPSFPRTNPRNSTVPGILIIYAVF